MSPPGRPKGEYRWAQPEGTPLSPPAVVIDTNVVLDWLVFDDPQVHPIVAAVEAGALRWLRSAAMAQELERVLDYPHVAARGADKTTVLARAAQHATPVPPARPAPLTLRCADPDDQGFIDLALAHPGSLLVSRDKALLALRRRALARGVQVLTPAQWQPR
jgi:predicted nucleic acid-binding protein